MMVIHIIYGRKVISVRAVEDSVPIHEAKLIALRAAVAAGEVTVSQALQVTFETVDGKPL
jgi:hypothetical protein